MGFAVLREQLGGGSAAVDTVAVEDLEDRPARRCPLSLDVYAVHSLPGRSAGSLSWPLGQNRDDNIPFNMTPQVYTRFRVRQEKKQLSY